MGIVAEANLIADLWDVGQGNCSVVRLPDNSLLIFDVGPRSSPLIDWLADKPRNIHSVVITHNDEDHAGALPSLVKMPGQKIGKIYLLQDRDKQSEKFQNIYRPVREEERAGRLEVLGAFKDTLIWESPSKRRQFRIVYPSFSENIDANTPNVSSAVICLIQDAKVRCVWPGDAPMRVIAERCGGSMPFILDGPHHGNPVDRKHKDFSTWANAFDPERVFISTGTNNKHNHPSEQYLRLQVDHGCRVLCSQLTKLCDNVRINNVDPVLQTSALLGLRPPRRGVPCRGCFRVTVRESDVLPDPWDDEHLARVKKLRRPKCLAKPSSPGSSNA